MNSIEEEKDDEGDCHHPAVVIDNGTAMCKAGFAGDTEPKLTFRNVTGRLPDGTDPNCRYKLTLLGKQEPDLETYVGDVIPYPPSVLNRAFPIDRGIVKDWCTMEKVWSYVFTQLQSQPKDRPVLLTEPPFNPKANRENAAEIFFEKFQVPSFHISLDTILALHAIDRSSGTVVNCGDGVTSVAALYEGFTFPQAMMRLDLAGTDVTDYLGILLSQKGSNFLNTATERNLLYDMKEKFCCVANNSENEISNEVEEVSYILPDGHDVKLGGETRECGEILFQPSLTGVEKDGIHRIVHAAIMQADIDSRKELYKNIILAGGTARLPGFEARLHSELQSMAPPNTKINIYSPSDGQHLVWRGGSKLAASNSFSNMWISKEEYQEYGPALLHTRCWRCT